jgi:hypothetical protein
MDDTTEVGGPMSIVHLQERRAIRRAIQIDCQVVRTRDFRLVAETTFDLSTDGMLVPTSLDVAIGDELIVSFAAKPFRIYFDLEATAARIVRGRRRSDRGQCVGVRFRSLDAIARQILRGALRYVPPPIPRRNARLALSL